MNERASEMRAHPTVIRYALMACFIHARTMAVTDDVVRLLLELIRHMDTQTENADRKKTATLHVTPAPASPHTALPQPPRIPVTGGLGRPPARLPQLKAIARVRRVVATTKCARTDAGRGASKRHRAALVTPPYRRCESHRPGTSRHPPHQAGSPAASCPPPRYAPRHAAGTAAVRR